MKNQNITKNRADKLISAYNRSFRCRSCDAKWDAQQNLQGITPWANDDTLKYFSARIQGTQYLGNGTFLMVRSTVGASKAGDKGRYKVNIFDLSGTGVEGFSAHTAREADVEYSNWIDSFDGLDHYREAAKRRARQLRREAKNITQAIK